MTAAITTIERRGNDFAIRLPVAIVKAANLRADQSVSIVVDKGCLVITPLRKEPLTLEQRLARFDPERHGGEVMASS